MPDFIRTIIVFIYDFRLRRILKRKARKILLDQKRSGNRAEIPAEISERYKEIWHPLSLASDKIWLKIYGGASGLWDERYIPETLYYTRVEPCLNNKSFSKAYTDKNFYDILLAEFGLPAVIVRNIEGVYYNSYGRGVEKHGISEMAGKAGKFIVKPSVDSGGGKGVMLFRKEAGGFRSIEGKLLTAEELISCYGKNFIIQPEIEGHPFYARFNPTSLNTVRVLTYRSVRDESMHILHNIFRVGATGRITDNQASGGFACGVTPEGSLTGKAVDKHGHRFTEVNGIRLEPGLKLEGFAKIRETALKVAERFHYSRLLGLDLCLDKEGRVILVEVNNVNNEINFYQMLNGPLFGEFTGEIISWCASNKRSFMIDFEI